MASEFALLYRWHDLIPDTVTFGGKTESSAKLLKNNAWVMEVGVDQMLLDSSKEAAGKMMGGGYCLTGDAMLKMLAIFVRVTCGIPVVLMGLLMGRGHSRPPGHAGR